VTSLRDLRVSQWERRVVDPRTMVGSLKGARTQLSAHHVPHYPPLTFRELIMSHKFLMDSNLGLRPDEQPWHDLFAQADIEPISTNDLERADKIFADHVPDIAFMPSADVHRLIRWGDHYYRGLAISTSKFTGEPTMKVLLVVKKDDRPPAWMTWRKRNTATSTARAPRPTSHPQSS
jgi:hypothetical protein